MMTGTRTGTPRTTVLWCAVTNPALRSSWKSPPRHLYMSLTPPEKLAPLSDPLQVVRVVITLVEGLLIGLDLAVVRVDAARAPFRDLS